MSDPNTLEHENSELILLFYGVCYINLENPDKFGNKQHFLSVLIVKVK